MPASIYDATDNDVWPDARERPPLAMREEIRRIARIEVTEEDIESLGFVPWYAKFYVAEQRVRARMDAAKAALPAPPSAPAADPEELQQLRRRVAKLERMVLGKNAVLLKAVGTAIGRSRREIEDRVKALEDRAPVPIPLPLLDQHDRPTMRYAGLWNATKSYQSGDLATHNGSGWVAQIDSTGLKPGDGVGWKLAIKGDPSHLKGLVQAEVRKQLGGRR